MPRNVVIGYGNRLRGDDGFGPLAAELVAARHLPEFQVIVAHQLGPEHAEPLSEAEQVIFFDAEIAGEPGTLRATAIAPKEMSCCAIAHHIGPANLLALAQTAYGRAPAAAIITAASRAFAHGTAPGAETQAAAKTAAALIVTLAERGRLHTETVCAALPAPA